MASEPTPHVLVLAAGAGRRFGSPKQLARLGGETLIQAAVARAVEVAGQAVTVVLGAHAAEVAPRLRASPASVVVNRRWEEGLASSLRTGVAQLPGSTEGVLITLADQAGVTAMDLRRLVAEWRRQPDHVAAAAYQGHVGVPAIFPSLYFPALLELKGDSGARLLLRRLADRTVHVPVPSAAIDIDTPEDLARLSPGSAPPASGGA
jgi:molybdenum cofactor cytidylyltransferase